MSKRLEQKEKRRKEILLVGLELFVRNGYAATKISDIAKKCDMSVGLLFHYFESKEKLYEELVQRGVSGTNYLMSIEQSNPIVFFEIVAEQALSYITKDRFAANLFILMSQARYNEALPQSIKDLVLQIDNLRLSMVLIEAGQKDETIRKGNPHALAVAYWAAIQGIAEEIALYPDTPCPESSWIVDILRRKK